MVAGSAAVTLDLLRHGEPAGGRLYRGHGIDDPLSELGWSQMRRALKSGGNWDAMVSSPMRRCREFAEELRDRSGVALTIDARLRELGFGAWEGRTPEAVRAADNAQWTAFYRDPEASPPPGAEPLAAFRARVDEAVADLACAHAGQRVLVVCHAGVIRSLVCRVLAAPAAAMFRIDVPPAACVRLGIDGAGDVRGSRVHWPAP